MTVLLFLTQSVTIVSMGVTPHPLERRWMEDDLIVGLFCTKRDEESEFCSDYRGLCMSSTS